ncbi:MAG: ABC transporter permease [Oligoflexales bacterium]|nr:ABC transporter permease [Oligoflexales bacterium]
MRRQYTDLKIIAWIAFRNLVSRKRNRQGLSFMTAVSILGVGIGVSALIIVLSVMGGFEQDLKRKMLKGQPHLEIMNENSLAGFSLLEFPLQTFSDNMSDILDIEPFTQADIVLKQGKHMSTAVLFGVDPNKKGHLWGFSDSMIEGNLADVGKEHFPMISADKKPSRWPGIVLGESLAGQLGASIGDEITVLSPEASSSSSVLAGGTISRHYVLVGTFLTGLFNYDSKWAVVSLDEGRKFMPDYDFSLDEEQYVSGIAINLKNPYNVDNYIKYIKSNKGLKPNTWKDTNAALLFALKLEKFTMGSILMLIVLVAAFSISGTMMMTVFHKKRQVCLLRSIGMTHNDVLRLFLFQGFIIGTVGILLGLFLGVGSCFLLSSFRYVDVPTNIYYLRTLPVKFLPWDYALICFLAWLLSLFGALYPALIASKQNPSSGLRL